MLKYIKKASLNLMSEAVYHLAKIEDHSSSSESSSDSFLALAASAFF